MTTGYITQFGVVHDIGASFTSASFTASGQQIKIGTIPKGSLIKVASLNMDTALSPTSLSLCQIAVGTILNPSLFLADATIDTFSAAFSSVNTNRGLLAADTDVYVRLSKNNMAAMPVAGSFQYFLEYYPPNQNKNLGKTFDT